MSLEHALELASVVNVAALWAVAIGGAFIAVTGYFIVRWQGEIQRAKDAAFETYKLGVSAQVAEARKEGIEAGKTAGNAILRAAELEKEAADARLETEKIKEAVAWRVIPPGSASELEKVLASQPGAVNLRYMDGDPEALFLAIQISQILAKSHWRVAPGAVKPPDAIVFGIGLPDASGVGAQTLRKAFSAAKVPFSPSALPPEGISFSISTIAGAPTLMVGSRLPALP